MSVGRRALFVVVALAAVATVAFLLLGSRSAPVVAPGEGGAADDSTAPEAGVAGRPGAEAKPAEAVGLAGGFEVVGLGDLSARLLVYKDRKPVVGQKVVVVSPRGETAERKTGEDGRVLFQGLGAGREWVLRVEGEGFAPVEVRGVAVRARGLTDLGDLLLGQRAVLRGRVVDDRGRPVAEANVGAYLGGGIDWSQGPALAILQGVLAPDAPSDQATSDASGEFELASLVPGAQYTLRARKAGYALYVQAGLVVSPERASATMTIRLAPGATVRGKVTDAEGRPVANAIVVALEEAGGGGNWRNAFSTVKKDLGATGADGTYAIQTLARGASYRFGVSAPGLSPLFDATAVRVDLELVRDFRLQRGGAIEGQVTDAKTGQPVAGATVVAIVGQMGFGPGGGRGRGRGGPGGGQAAPAADGGEGANAPTASAQTVQTGEDGRFRLDGLRPGPVAVGQVKARGYADLAATVFTNNTWGEIRAGETLVVNLSLEPGGSVTGKVFAQTAQGAVPLPGAQVALLSMQSMWTGFPTATSGEDGSYRIDGVRPGSQFTVTATAAGFVAPVGNPFDPASQARMPDEGGVVQRDVTLTAAGAVEGVVSDAKGLPVPGARVRVRAAEGRPGRGGGFNLSFVRQFLPGGSTGVALTDGEGRYRIEGVDAEGPQVVEAESDEHVPAQSEAFEVRAGEVRRVAVTLTGGGALRGRVVDERGAVVAGARVQTGWIDPEDASLASLQGWRADRLLEPRVHTTDAEGWFHATRLRPGRTLVRAEKEGYVPFYRRDLEIRADETRENYVVTLVKGESISGVVKGDDGRPVAGAFVSVTRLDNPPRGFGGGGAPAAGSDDGSVEPSMSDRTDGQGRFTVENVPPGGTYSVLVFFAPGYQGYAQGSETAIVRQVPSGRKDVEFVLTRQEEGAPGMGFPNPPRPAPGGAGAAPGGGRRGTRLPVPIPGMN